MFKIDFYSNQRGESPALIFLEELRSSPARDQQIQYQQLIRVLTLLQSKGTFMGEAHTKHLEDGIWELCPGCNRILYFFFQDETFVLLHAFRKRTRKTPRSEIERAKAERADWLSRFT